MKRNLMKKAACGLMAGMMMASSGFMTTFSYDSGDSISIVSAATTYEYFPKCSSSYTSLADALRSVGADSSYSYRKNTIAPLNGYTSSSYTGTAAQNTNLLNLLKQGKLVKSKKTTQDSCWSKISQGEYVLVPKCAQSACVDIDNWGTNNGANAHIWTKGNSQKNQAFKLVANSDGSGTLYALHTSNKVLDVSGGVARNCTNIQLYQANGTASQKFFFKSEGGGWFSLRSAINTNYAVDVYGASSKNGANLNLYQYNGSSAQLFRLDTFKAASNPNNNNGNGTASLIVNSSYNVSVSNKAKENKPHYENKEGSRSASNYNTVINQFNVATNSRYKRTSTSTYCNIFAWDVMSAMRVSLPHWIKNNAPATSTTSGAYEINANATYNWLAGYGSKYGWSKVSASEAQARANKGYPTIAIWKNTSGGSGHVMVVRPEGNGYTYSSSKGPVISQAGATNINYWNVKNAMGSKTPVYYTHS